MEEKWFADWVNKHASFFGLTTEAEIKTLMSWFQIFSAAGYAIRELAYATDQISETPSLLLGEARYAGKLTAHLVAIQDVIRHRRAVSYQREADILEHDLGTCTTCGGSGYVVVPHLRGINNGVWVPIKVTRGCQSFYTVSVLCHCRLGQWITNHLKPEKQPMTLQKYSDLNPGWPEQMRRRHEELTAQSDLEPVAPVYAASLDRLLARLKKSNP